MIALRLLDESTQIAAPVRRARTECAALERFALGGTDALIRNVWI